MTMYLEAESGLGFWGALIGAGVSLLSKKKSKPSGAPQQPIAAPTSSRAAKIQRRDIARMQTTIGRNMDRMNRIIANERTRRSATRGLLPLAIAGGVVVLVGGMFLRGGK